MSLSRWCARGESWQIRTPTDELGWGYSMEHQYCREVMEVEDEAALCSCVCHQPLWVRDKHYVRVEVCVAGQVYATQQFVDRAAPAGAMAWELDRAVGEIKQAAGLVSYPASVREREEGPQ